MPATATSLPHAQNEYKPHPVRNLAFYKKTHCHQKHDVAVKSTFVNLAQKFHVKKTLLTATSKIRCGSDLSSSSYFLKNSQPPSTPHLLPVSSRSKAKPCDKAVWRLAARHKTVPRSFDRGTHIRYKRHLYHIEMPECCHNRFFLLRRTRWYSVTFCTPIEVFTFFKSALIFHLCNIQRRYRQTILLLNPCFDFPVCSTAFHILQIITVFRLIIHISINNIIVYLFPTQKGNRLNVAREDRKYVICQAVRPT